MQVARDALLDLRDTTGHLGVGEVPVTVVNRFELASIHHDRAAGEQAHLAAKRNEANADLAQGAAIVLAEVGDRLVVGDQPAEKPHQLDVAPSLALEPAARLHPVEITVNVQLQQG